LAWEIASRLPIAPLTDVQRDLYSVLVWLLREGRSWSRSGSSRQFPGPRLYLAALLALNGNEAEARETVKHYLSLPGIEIRSIRALEAWLWRWSPDTQYWAAYVKRLSEGLRRAGMPEE
jgi:hypothetical protein